MERREILRPTFLQGEMIDHHPLPVLQHKPPRTGQGGRTGKTISTDRDKDMATFITHVPQGERAIRRGLKATIEEANPLLARKVEIAIDGLEGDEIVFFVHPSRRDQLAQCFEELARMLRSQQGGRWEVRS